MVAEAETVEGVGKINPIKKIKEKGFCSMNDIIKIVSGIGVLIAIYLFVKNSDSTAKIINSFAYNSVQGIKALQGR